MFNNIKKIRISNGYSIQDIARKLNVKTSIVDAWEHGIDIPSIEQANILCDIFSVSLDDIFSEKPIEKRNVSQMLPKYKTIIYQVYDSFIQINKKESELW